MAHKSTKLRECGNIGDGWLIGIIIGARELKGAWGFANTLEYVALSRLKFQSITDRSPLVH